MLTGYQCEIVAYLGDGEIICHACAVSRHSTVAIEKVDMGLSNGTDLRPIIRYSLDESSVGMTWEYASEHVREFLAGHPAVVLTPHQEDRLIDRWSNRHPVNETCGSCCEEIV